MAEIHQLYGAQSHFIDNGLARAWAGTFTADGQFRSPSYPAPVNGASELVAFAERFFAAGRDAGETVRHVVTNTYVTRTGPECLTVQAYLQIVATPAGGPSRLVRQTTISDELVADGGRWRIRCRTVHRDDQRPPHGR
ncbi:nuclear transport factor 2 family protein [Amycolatopsis rhizosphaerae]|uniref:Nuclear transport factor 2 family protein n=1 Tax=Amycolatopsis rhizosphaerae TaxID=2053003 RepID=A0A558B114_9PSEU|nr:nuclear transport factor 2 family protein [Amycolatopsis rhizosphaerae]